MGLKRQAYVVAQRPEWAADPGGPIRIRFCGGGECSNVVAVSASAAQSMSFLIQKPRLLQAKKKKTTKIYRQTKTDGCCTHLVFS
jgi:hypothetical protein